jgi:hypothetical protein
MPVALLPRDIQLLLSQWGYWCYYSVVLGSLFPIQEDSNA